MSFLSLFKKPITVATHNGSFHADDVFAVATLSIWAEKQDRRLEVIRTRDKTLIDKADIVVDVGDKYDPENKRFDHHQRGGAGARSVGNPTTSGPSIPYASFGLVWKHYGDEICSTEEARGVEEKLVVPIDARDNGMIISTANELGIVDHRTSNAISDFNLTWQEDLKDLQKQFCKAVIFAKEILEREIIITKGEIDGGRVTSEAIRNQGNPLILILDKPTFWKKVVISNENTKLVVYPSKDGNVWCVQTARDSLEDYDTNRIKFPESWQGLRDEELIKVSGVNDAIFCHKGGFIASAKTKEGALSLAKKALEK